MGLVGNGDVNGDDDEGISSIVERFVRFDWRDLLLLLRSFRSSQSEESCGNVGRLVPLGLARFPRLVLLLLLGS